MTTETKKHLASTVQPSAVEASAVLSVVNTHQISALGELQTRTANIDSANYYKFTHLDGESYHFLPSDRTNGKGFW